MGKRIKRIVDCCMTCKHSILCEHGLNCFQKSIKWEEREKTYAECICDDYIKLEAEVTA